MTDAIELKSFLPALRRYPALVIGPGVSTHSGIFKEIADAIKTEFKSEFSPDVEVSTYYELMDSLEDPESVAVSKIQELIKDKLVHGVPSAQIRHFSEIQWSAIVSLSPDTCFEDAVRERLEGMATTRTFTIIDSPDVMPRSRTLPLYKLLGNPRSRRQEATAAISQSDLLLRQNTWIDLLSTLPDYVKESPMLIVGNEDNSELVERFIAAVLSLRTPRPSTFIYLDGNGSSLNKTTLNLMRGKARLLLIRATLKEFCQGVESTLLQPRQLPLSLSDDLATSKDRILDELQKFNSVISIVPSEIPAHYDVRSKHHQLLDGLFRPTSIDWNPFLANYHLHRTQAVELSEAVHTRLSVGDLTRMLCFALRGEAGTGKSCVMKETAVILSQKGYLVVWLNRLPLDSGPGAIRELTKSLARLAKKSSKGSAVRIVLLCDEHWSSRISPYELAYEVNASGAPIALVFSVRNTEVVSETGVSISLPVMLDEEIELSVSLDEAERSAMPEMLVRIDAAPDIETARAQAARIDTRNASDVLCHLWFLIPETRSAISLSLEDEYFTLADVRRNIQELADEGISLDAKVRSAYECTAVCSDFGIGIPTEVLVRAIGISFDDWVSMCVEGKPMWGLVYPEQSADGTETLYWTRNDVVTKVLLRALNGGLGHGGEIRVLKSLVKACEVGTEIYRSFLIDVLVRSRKILRDRYSLEQGIELFELARETLPFPDRTIEHQYGLWLKDKGADLGKAHEQLQKALGAPDYPAATASERPEHIHTSLAATVVGQAKEGIRTLESALAEVKEHLRYAQTPSFFNPHTTHVFGTLLLELSQMHSGEHETEIRLQSVAEALPMIEKTYQLIGATGARAGRYGKDIEMLSSLQQRLIDSIGDVETMRTIAEELFSINNDQLGYAVAARKMLVEAARKGKGRFYNNVKDYIDECIEKIESTGSGLSDRLRSVRVDLYVRWQLQGLGGVVDWGTITEDLELLCGSPLYKDDPMKQFYYGVALFHKERITDANIVFSRLRALATAPKLKGDARAYFLGNGGAPKRLQGVLRKSHDRWYVEISDLGTDLPLRDPQENLVDRKDIHCYMGFSFFGPFATQERPDAHSLLLPL
jgi:hypothetical protein